MEQEPRIKTDKQPWLPFSCVLLISMVPVSFTAARFHRGDKKSTNYKCINSFGN